MKATLKIAIVLLFFCTMECNAKSSNIVQTICCNSAKTIHDKMHSICMRRDIKGNKQGRIPIRRAPSFTFDLALIKGHSLLIMPNEICSTQPFTLIIKNCVGNIIEYASISTDQELYASISTDQELFEANLPATLKGDIYITIETNDYIYTGTTTIL